MKHIEEQTYREEQYSLPVGAVIVWWPKHIPSEERDDLLVWWDMIRRKLKRASLRPTTERSE